MTVFYKAESREAARQNDLSRLRGKAGALIHYVWRADLKALARASMDTAINSYHRDLLRYVDRDGHREDVAATLARHLLSDTPAMMTAEIAALMEDAEAGDGVIEHLIVSVREGDDLIENFEEAVDLLVDALGVGNCPVIGAIHSDTDHKHFHLVVVRVDVKTGSVVDLPRYDIIRGHQALAVMEDRFGWQREADARWQVMDGRLILDGKTDVGPADDPRQWPDGYFHHPDISAGGKKAERQSGYVSAERHVREVVPGIIAKSQDQAAFLAELAKEGIELTRAHRGAAYLVRSSDASGQKRTESVKTSVVRGWGWKALEAKYGPLPNRGGPAVQAKNTQPVGDDPARPRYAAARSQYHERLNAMMRNVRAALPGGPASKAALTAARAACVFPSFGEWAAGARAPEIGDVLFAHAGARVIEGGKGFASTSPVAASDAKFSVLKSRGRVTYHRRGATGSARLVDFGDKVVLVGPTSDDEIRKALTLFSLRGVRVVTGSGFSDRELRRAQRLAAELGMNVLRRGVLSEILAEPSKVRVQPKSSSEARGRLAPEIAHPTAAETHRNSRKAGVDSSGPDLGR